MEEPARHLSWPAVAHENDPVLVGVGSELKRVVEPQEHAGDASSAVWEASCLSLVSDLGSFRDCQREAFASDLPTTEDIANWACASNLTTRQQSIVVQEYMLALNPADVGAFAVDFRNLCGKYAKRMFIVSAIEMAAEHDPLWLARVADSLTPELLFDGTDSTAAIELIAFLGQGEGGSWARNLAEEGGRGLFGGTPSQIAKASVASIVVQSDPADSVEYALSVLESPAVPGEERISQSMVAFLCSPTGNCWSNGDAEKALDLVWSILDDPRFAKESAQQVIHGTPVEAPQGANSTQWAQLRAKAQEVLDIY